MNNLNQNKTISGVKDHFVKEVNDVCQSVYIDISFSIKKKLKKKNHAYVTNA